jgi:hypothetical protein
VDPPLGGPHVGAHLVERGHAGGFEVAGGLEELVPVAGGGGDAVGGEDLFVVVDAFDGGGGDERGVAGVVEDAGDVAQLGLVGVEPGRVVERLEVLGRVERRQLGGGGLPEREVGFVAGGDLGLDALLVGVGDGDDLDLGAGERLEARDDALGHGVGVLGGPDGEGGAGEVGVLGGPVDGPARVGAGAGIGAAGEGDGGRGAGRQRVAEVLH